MASKGAAQFPAINSPQRAGRGKVALKPGRSLMDWIRLTHSEANLSGLNGKVLDVTAEELSRHNKKNDAWICLKGKVYNITPYMEYHPGGEDELMRGAGRDATDLFNQIHKWVNAESMLQKCFVGKMKMSSLWLQRATSLSGRLPGPVANVQQKAIENVNNKGNAEVLNFKVPLISEGQMPKYDWFQSDSSVSLVIYSKWKEIQKEHIIVDLKGKCLQVSARIKEYTYHLHLELENPVSSSYEVKVGGNSGAIEILFVKESREAFWQNLGRSLTGHNSFTKTKDNDVYYRPCQLVSKERVTHDTFLLTFSLPSGTTMMVPLGQHVHLKKHVDGMEIVRSYTPVLSSMDVPQDPLSELNGHKLFLMIKMYSKGALTSVLNKIEVGETMEISDYQGDFDCSHVEECCTLVLLAAGTGFTPMVRLIYWALVTEPKQRTIKLMFFNKTEDDILWREYLNKLSEGDSRLQVKFVLSEPSENWSGSRGRISKELLETFIPSETVESKVFICVCGPTPFSKTALEYLEELGYSRDIIHAFLG